MPRVLLCIALSLFSTIAASKGLFSGIVGAVVGKTVGGAAGKAAVNKGEVNLDEPTLIKVSAEINKRLPMLVDKDTRLDSTLGGPGKKLTYYYTTVTLAANEIDMNAFYKTFVPRVRNGVCSSEDLKIFLSNGVTLIYSYRSSEGKNIGKIDIPPKQCGYAS